MVLPHGLGRDLVAELALALSHGAGRSDRGHFHHPQESRRQVALNVLPVSAGLAFWTSLRTHSDLSRRLMMRQLRAGLRLYRNPGPD